jgi:hypothetical protein
MPPAFFLHFGVMYFARKVAERRNIGRMNNVDANCQSRRDATASIMHVVTCLPASHRVRNRFLLPIFHASGIFLHFVVIYFATDMSCLWHFNAFSIFI